MASSGSKSGKGRKGAAAQKKDDSFDLVTPGRNPPVTSPPRTPCNESTDSDRSLFFRSIRRKIGLDDSIERQEVEVQTDQTGARPGLDSPTSPEPAEKIVSKSFNNTCFS